MTPDLLERCPRVDYMAGGSPQGSGSAVLSPAARWCDPRAHPVRYYRRRRLQAINGCRWIGLGSWLHQPQWCGQDHVMDSSPADPAHSGTVLWSTIDLLRLPTRNRPAGIGHKFRSPRCSGSSRVRNLELVAIPTKASRRVFPAELRRRQAGRKCAHPHLAEVSRGRA